ncbi:MAG: ABC transporter permease [Ruminococcus sp.]|nr:ABC transporter permease [Ruminococcus sp.]
MIENIRLSFQGIFSHKIRSFLTMLGIIIGIAAIIAIVSTIKGTNEQIKNNLIGSGNNTVNVRLVQGEEEMMFDWQAVPDGVPVVSQKVKESINDIEEVECCSLYRKRSYMDSIFCGNKMIESASLIGIDKDYFHTTGLQIKKGKGFSPFDYKGQSKVCIIDDTIVSSLFGDENPIGATIDIKGQPFTVIGVAVKTKEFEPVINSIEDYWTYFQEESGTLYIPSEVWPILFRYDEPQNVIAKAVNTDAMTNAGKLTADALNDTLSVGEKSNISYKAENLLEQAQKMQDLSASTNSMLIWIASISLLVGGIGVMNIMLVSVTERTREIGLKKALGARRGRILMQFLTEAAVLTSIGGIIGVGAGIGLAQVISRMAEVPVAISTPAIIISVVFSMVVGIVFGLIPSIKAARLNPIDALRYE